MKKKKKKKKNDEKKKKKKQKKIILLRVMDGSLKAWIILNTMQGELLEDLVADVKLCVAHCVRFH